MLYSTPSFDGKTHPLPLPHPPFQLPWGRPCPNEVHTRWQLLTHQRMDCSETERLTTPHIRIDPSYTMIALPVKLGLNITYSQHSIAPQMYLVHMVPPSTPWGPLDPREPFNRSLSKTP